MCCIAYFWMCLPSSFFHRFAYVSETSLFWSESLLHKYACKVSICPIAPIDSPLKEENIILDPVLIGRPRVWTSPPPWKIWYVNCHGFGLLGRWWSAFFIFRFFRFCLFHVTTTSNSHNGVGYKYFLKTWWWITWTLWREVCWLLFWSHHSRL